jgi:asparagine synthase (glutamine-hydrolysing)
MIDAIRHRGPDGGQVWTDEAAQLCLGHRRLAIVDLSPEGAQPMHSASGRYVVAFNGEIYNHGALRVELERAGAAPRWRGHSDTEVLLAAIEHWGVGGALERSNGMFAFALWDRSRATLILARDRFGEKPLYVWQSARGLAFASELKALREAPGWRGDVDRDAVAALLRFDYVPDRQCIYRGVWKLAPASYAEFAAAGSEPRIMRFWDAAGAAYRASRSPLDASDAEAIDGLEQALRRAVGMRMQADVPLGAFLSGGIDSSVVVAMMQAQSPRPVRTFSIGFDDEAYNEAHHAAAVASHLATDHTELIVQPADALAVVPALPRLYDEPFADASQIPTYLVCAMARRHVTVALSGDAGDELFGGYNRHHWIPRLWRMLERLPLPMRRAGAGGVLALSPGTWDQVVGVAARVTGRPAPRTPGDKLHKLARVVGARSVQDLYLRLVTFWDTPEAVVIGASTSEPKLPWDDRLATAEAVMAADTQSYLPDDILVKVDRASMGVSLETRVPLLDPEVYDYAWRLPMRMKIRNGVSKWALRETLYRHVPQALIDRPKSGFGIPIDAWLRGPLRDWAEHLLDESRLRQGGYLRPEPVRTAWREHLSGRRNWQYHLWSVLMFEAWRDAYDVA